MLESAWRRLIDPTVRPALVIWVSGYLLVEISAWVQGRMAFGGGAAISLSLLAMGIGWTLAVDGLALKARGRPPLVRWTLVAAAVALAGLAQTAADLGLWRLAAVTLRPDWRGWALDMGPRRVLPVLLLYVWTIGFAASVVWTGRMAQAAAVREAALQAAASRAETAALRLQLNPHFLFNALNSVASMVAQDRKAEAEEMICGLSDLLRATTDADPGGHVSLSDEIEVIMAYLAIERMRFGERLAVVTDVAAGVEMATVPSFILQPLAENAVKHGVAAASGHWVVVVHAERRAGDLVLSVVNRRRSGEGASATALPRRKGIGLDNLRQRLELAYGERGRLDVHRLANGYRAAIRLPFDLASASRQAGS